MEPHFADVIRTTYIFSCLSRPDLPVNCDNLSIKLVQFSVVSKLELINSSFYEQFIDISEILVKAEINLL